MITVDERLSQYTSKMTASRPARKTEDVKVSLALDCLRAGEPFYALKSFKMGGRKVAQGEEVDLSGVNPDHVAALARSNQVAPSAVVKTELAYQSMVRLWEDQLEPLQVHLSRVRYDRDRAAAQLAQAEEQYKVASRVMNEAQSRLMDIEDQLTDVLTSEEAQAVFPV